MPIGKNPVTPCVSWADAVAESWPAMASVVLRTEDEYLAAVAWFDRLWSQVPDESTPHLMARLIVLIEDFERRVVQW